ncbi:MAG: biotin carboxylase N-terminal domain-containing protein [Microthrixaceae bacterium]
MASLKRLLIANRGEIAVRVARAAHGLGMEAVGVYSEVDRTALHTEVMDSAVALGGRTAAESYLRGDAVIEAALRTGCDAVHPGYGFLAENAEFAAAVAAAGLIWVGPTPEQIELLGDKVAAKRAAVDAGVPTTEAVVVTADSDPRDLPLPAMVKAAAGGGGRGMRVVTDRSDFRSVVAAATREAEAAFGDGTVFVEPLIESGRHVEVQILGDHHGNVVHLGERDCSIQRRHQKVIEEAPSPGVDAATRERLCDGAVALARGVGYRGAGTVEYLVGADGTIAFLEVNTRLQVEHPVTEAVWGVDLVELQLRIAAGEELPFTQDELSPEGHAVEARLVAEDPDAGWLPSSGRITSFHIDTSGPIRVDSGVGVGSVVSSEYDSLLAKVISHDRSRDVAVGRLGRALRTAEIAGVATNAATLAAICSDEAFIGGTVDTAYLDEHPEVVHGVGATGDDRIAHALAAVFCLHRTNRGADHNWAFAPSGWRNVATQGQRRTMSNARGTDASDSIQVEYVVRDSAAGSLTGATVAEVRLGPFPEPDDEGLLGPDDRRVARVVATVSEPVGPSERRQVSLELDGISRSFAVESGDPGVLAVFGTSGSTAWFQQPSFAEREATEAASAPVSPLPGSVVSVHVAPGDEVHDGDLLVIVEAMKMEHRIEARATHTVAEVRVSAGDKVDAGTALVTFAD